MAIVFKQLPNEYQEVEWIASDGNQYLLTNVSGDIVRKMEVIFSVPTSFTADWGEFISNWQSEDHNCTRIGITRMGASAIGINCYNNSISRYRNTFCSGYKNRKTTLISTYPSSLSVTPSYGLDERSRTEGLTNTNNIGIFANTSGSGGTDAVIYSVKFYSSSGLIFNGIPCYRKSNSVIGLYDTISNTFFTNRGTGSFTRGSDMTNVTQIIYNGNELNKLVKDGSVMWEKPFTYITGTLPTGVASLNCYRSSSNEPTAGTGTISNNGTIYYEDTLTFSATASSGYTAPTTTTVSSVSGNVTGANQVTPGFKSVQVTSIASDYGSCVVYNPNSYPVVAHEGRLWSMDSWTAYNYDMSRNAVTVAAGSSATLVFSENELWFLTDSQWKTNGIYINTSSTSNWYLLAPTAVRYYNYNGSIIQGTLS